MDNNHLLFVYGSLLGRTGYRPIDNIMTRLCRPLGNAIIQARLYDLGSYPGAVPSRRRNDRVVGQLLRMRHARAVLHALDHYEAFHPGQAVHSEFVRERVPVTLPGRRHPIKAWVYFYNGPVSDVALIPGGDYLHHRDGQLPRPIR